MTDDPDRDSDDERSDDSFLRDVARSPALRPPDELERLGAFRIEREIGRGGMGIVYEAEDENLGRRVALKVMPPAMLDDPERRRRFLREARAAAAVSHENVATVYGAGEADGHIYLSMDLIEGETLRARLPSLTPDETLDIARGVLRGLDAAHQAQLIHRDLKSDNVMITAAGVAKILDFGLAKFQLPTEDTEEEGSASTLTEEGRVLGTPGYMSPEQAAGRAVDHRTDIFAFGVVLYEMLTGRRPFRGGTSMEVIIATSRDEPEPPSSLQPAVSAALDAVVMRCLAKEPGDRFESAQAILDALEADSPHDDDGGPRRATRGRPWWALAALAAAATVGWVGLRGDDAPVPAAAPSASATSATAAAPFPGWPPPPPSEKPEAVAAFVDGITALRAGKNPAPHYKRAVELDPAYAGAWLQLAYSAYDAHQMDAARQRFDKAAQGRATLPPRYRMLLDALAHVVKRQPADIAAYAAAIDAMAQRWPDDILLLLRRKSPLITRDESESVRHLRRILKLDPGAVIVHGMLPQRLAYLGRFDEALAASDDCLRVTPDSIRCLSNRFTIASWEGRCDVMESAARQAVAMHHAHPGAHMALADALAGQRKPLAAVREGAAQARKRHRKSLPAVTGMVGQSRLLDDARLELFAGQFDEALRLADELEKVTHGHPARDAHGWIARVRVLALSETDRVAEAADVAKAYLDRRDAWEPTPRIDDFVIARQATPLMLAALRKAGRLDDAKFDARRVAWAEGLAITVPKFNRPYLWLQAHASIVETAADAKLAFGRLSDHGEIPAFQPFTQNAAGLGRAYALMGDDERAAQWLGRVTRHCRPLMFPVVYTRAFVDLGSVRERQGNEMAACDAYAEVLRRWGNAKPRSLTAEAARARVTALACGT